MMSQAYERVETIPRVCVRFIAEQQYIVFDSVVETIIVCTIIAIIVTYNYFQPTPLTTNCLCLCEMLQSEVKWEDFEAKRTLGTGSFGRVMLCKYKPGGEKFYAIKVLDKKKVTLITVVILEEATQHAERNK